MGFPRVGYHFYAWKLILLDNPLFPALGVHVGPFLRLQHSRCIGKHFLIKISEMCACALKSSNAIDLYMYTFTYTGPSRYFSVFFSYIDQYTAILTTRIKNLK